MSGRSFIPALLIMFFASATSAQIFQGGKVGESLGFGTKVHLSYLRPVGDSTQDSGGGIGWGGGLIIPLRLTKLVYIQSEFTFTRAGKIDLDGIALPVLFLTEEEKGWRFGGGPYFSIATNDNPDHISWREFFYGIVMDGSYYLAGMQLGARATFSLTDVVDHRDHETTVKQHLLGFELYYAVDIAAIMRNIY